MPPTSAEDGLIDSDSMLLSVAFACYARNVIAFRNQSKKTEEHHLVTLKSLVGYLGDIPITCLSFDKVRDWKLSMEARNLSAITIRGYLIKLRVVLAYLHSKGYSVLPPEQIPLPKRVDRVPDIVSPEQVQLLINSTRKARNKAIISMLYSTGLRVSELCALNRIDIQEDYFTVIGKGGKSRICFIDKRTRRLLNRYLSKRSDNDPSLFISPLIGARMTPGGVQELFKYARKKAGFDFPVHPHTLRHSFATNLMANGCHIYTLSRLMGHASISTTQIYLHLADPQLGEEYKKYHTT